jgi:hypothetical protein
MLVKMINGVDTRTLTTEEFTHHVKNTPDGNQVQLVVTDPADMYGAVQGFTETYDAPTANKAGLEHYASADPSMLYMAQSPPAIGGGSGDMYGAESSSDGGTSPLSPATLFPATLSFIGVFSVPRCVVLLEIRYTSWVV